MNNTNENSIITNRGEFTYKTDEEYVRRIFSIAFELKKAGVPYTDNKILDGWQLRFPWCEGDIICHFGSYSNNAGCVESMGFPWDEGDCTAHTPEDMAQKIIEYYKENNNMNNNKINNNELNNLPIIPTVLNLSLNKLFGDEDEPDWAWEIASDELMDSYIQNYALVTYGRKFASYKYTKEDDYSTTITNIIPGPTIDELITKDEEFWVSFNKSQFYLLPQRFREWLANHPNISNITLKNERNLDEMYRYITTLDIYVEEANGENWQDISNQF